jgi:hypothetical protein
MMVCIAVDQQESTQIGQGIKTDASQQQQRVSLELLVPKEFNNLYGIKVHMDCKGYIKKKLIMKAKGVLL